MIGQSQLLYFIFYYNVNKNHYIVYYYYRQQNLETRRDIQRSGRNLSNWVNQLYKPELDSMFLRCPTSCSARRSPQPTGRQGSQITIIIFQRWALSPDLICGVVLQCTASSPAYFLFFSSITDISAWNTALRVAMPELPCVICRSCFEF